MQAMLALAMGSALLGIEVGWQPIEEGGLEYIVQIDPETLARLKPGDELATGIRPVLRDVRRYRIVIGKGPLPRVALPEGPVSSSGNTIQPRSAPAPLAAGEPQRSILIPPDSGTVESRPAPLAATQPVVPGPRVAVVPRLATPAPAPTPTQASPPITPPAMRVVPSVDALPEAPARVPAKPSTPLAERSWQAPAATAAAPPASAPIAPPKAIDKGGATLVAPPLVNEPKTLQSKPPIDVGGRYRNVPLDPPPSTPPSNDRYRNFAPPPVAPPPVSTPSKLILPPPPTENRVNPTVDKSAKIEDFSKAISKPPAELAGPLLPPPSIDPPSVKMKVAAKPPAFEFKEPAPLGDSKLMADTLALKPNRLLSDPAVRPASVEPQPPTVAAATTAPVATAVAPSAVVEQPSRPWLALTLALFALFASLGGNIFLGWVAHDARSRYGSLLRETTAS